MKNPGRMGAYFDSSVLMNPLYEYLKWLATKIFYQCKYWGAHLRISYKAHIHGSRFGKCNFIGKYTILTKVGLGDFSYIANHCTISYTEIGKYCSIGPNVKIAPGRHPSAIFVSTHPSFLKRNFAANSGYAGNLPVTIGNDVWIGANALIIDGVSIGDGAIIGANAVVTKDVSPYCIVGGVPAKVIRKRFADEQIAQLLEFKWWDKSEEWIRQHTGDFDNIEVFLKKHRG
jgi:acetyltransferase-like isoleucine patch superfamily enzyme